ncbi:hypothetical protein ANPL_00600 [Anaplasma platys]|uniref:Uncharacterized protein n=1 Tax=Anaplasma platys TaxID=949 RepID=A0A858PXE3_9RICK|nr:hypothetical protein ANPL_00600 [Anaplasma platys]
MIVQREGCCVHNLFSARVSRACVPHKTRTIRCNTKSFEESPKESNAFLLFTQGITQGGALSILKSKTDTTSYPGC